MAATNAIPPGQSFSVLAFDDCKTVELSAQSLVLTSHISAHVGPPLDLPPHWEVWHGKLLAKAYAETNLAILISRAGEPVPKLERDLTAFLFALMLCGVPDYREAIWLSGTNQADELSGMSTLKVDMFYRTPGQQRPKVDDAVLGQSASLAAGILRFFGSTDYYRVRLGFNRLINGLKRREARPRLHEFVASLDGLMALPKGRSKIEFGLRGPTFGNLTGTDPFATLYDLRSAEEHLHSWKPIIDPGALLAESACDALSLAWADTAERLACDVYRRLILNPGLLDEFKDETTTRAFWAVGASDRLARWGAPLSLTLDPKPFAMAISRP